VTLEQRGCTGWTDHVVADLSTDEGVATLVGAMVRLLDGRPLHALVNNAGVSPKTPFKERLGVLNGDLAGWRGVFALNFFAPLALARGLAPALHRGRGAVVNVTSIAGHAVHPFAGSAYSTSKTALSALTREMAVELAPLGVRVNAVAPGEIETEMIGPEYEPLVARIPMARMGTAQEVAGVIYQLCDGDFGYVTGSEVFVTGGQHLL
jgi:NAD(P)-dependent dehydrogenase (short-subunit alcohol dehydrogenase family)